MKHKARYFLVLLASLLCFCCVAWMRKEKANYARITPQEGEHQQSPNSSECVELRKILTLKPNRFTEDHYIKLFEKIQKCRWIKNSDEHQKIRSQLEKCCNATRNFVVTQVNAPLGTKITYEAEAKKTFEITQDTLELIPETYPFKNHILKRCSVIGNGGILTNRSCGKEINEADFVFRCNIPPIMGYEDDVGTKTDVVTLNPSILRKRYHNLNTKRKPFMEYVSSFEKSLILLPAFSYSYDTSTSFKVSYTLHDFGANQQALFFNPPYMKSIAKFWNNQGIRENRISSGLLILSAALEMCEEVWLYGFWPFSKDLHGNQLFHHYYDNVLPKKVHSFSNEFYKLLLLHMKGVVKIHADRCENTVTSNL